MCGQELRRRLHAVDPDLNIVPAGRHHWKNKAGDDWDKAAGVICSSCGREAFRARDGLCMPCWEQKHEIEVRDRTGITNWLPMDIIKQITHQAQKDQD